MHNNRLLWTFVLALSLIAFTNASYGPPATPAPELIRRADKPAPSTSAAAATSSQKDNASNTNQPTNTGGNNQATITAGPPSSKGGSGGSASNTGTNTGADTGTKSGTRTKAVPYNSPPGGINMETPSIMDAMQYFPIGGPPVTFVWNMTSVLVNPTAVNVEAYCSVNQQYYTIASNYSAQQTSITWDTGKYQASATAPLLVETYTLYIYDSSKARTAIPSPGQLSTFNNLMFGLYTPKSATPLSQFHCDLCSFATTIFSSHEVRVLLGTAFIFAVSMAWFIAGVAF